jgi:peptide/nickel transport system substrate-binding protein
MLKFAIDPYLYINYFKKMSKHKTNLLFTALILLSASILILFSSCGKNGNQTDDQSKIVTDLPPVDTAGAVTGDWIIRREMADAEKLNPIVTNDASAEDVYSFIYEALNDMNYENYELIPWIATLPEISEDHLTFTYKLRHDVKFSDGKPLTGEDVIFTIKAIKNPFADDAALRNYFEAVEKVELLNNDPYTVVFKMAKPYWRAIYALGSTSICPKHILDPKGLTDKYTWKETTDFNIAGKNPAMKEFAEFLNSQEVSREPQYVLGSGPYKLEGWQTGQAITLVRNKDYWGNSLKQPYLDKIVFKVIQDEAASVVAAKNKEVDMMYVISPQDFYKNLQNADQFDLIKATPSEPVYSYIGWNLNSPLFSDKRVRWAMSHLIDRNTIIDKIAFGQSVKIQSPVFYKDKKYLNADLSEITYDPEKAKQLLAEAGWKDSDGDGVLDKVVDGKKLDFKFMFLNNNNAVRRQTLLVIIEALKKVGIQADLQDLEWSVYLDKLKKHEFDATLAAWQLSVVPPDPYQLWHSSQIEGEGSNYISFRNAESDKLIVEYRQEFDENKRIELLKKWQKLIYDEQPYTFLWSPKSRYIYNKRFKNARFYNRGNSPIVS